MPTITCKEKTVELLETPVYKIPNTCPSCGTPTTHATVGDDDEGVGLICPNTFNCDGQLLARLIYWCKKESMEIEDLGEVMLERLFDAGVRYPWNLYFLKEQVMFNAGFGTVQACNALNAIKASKDRGLERVLTGLGIPKAGHTISRKLARAFPDFDTLRRTNKEDLMKVVGVTESAADSFLKWYEHAENVVLVNWLKKAGVSLKSATYNPSLATGAFVGKTVVFTGELDSMERPKAEALVEAQGGRCTGSVSKKTTFVVAGAEPGNKKITKAAELKIPVLDETTFLKMLHND